MPEMNYLRKSWETSGKRKKRGCKIMKNVSRRILCVALALLLGLALNSTATMAESPYRIAVIVKGTESDFWQIVLQGAKAAGKELGDAVRIETFGPPSEADIDKQVSIVENVVSRRPDAIVIASTSSDATVPALERAYDMGIKIIVIDTRLNTDKYHSFLATDNVKGGALAAEKLVEAIKATNRPLKGKVAVISALAGVKTLIDRYEGFTSRLKEIAPGIELIPTRYINSDVSRAMATAEDLITSYPDLLGFFADNNLGGDGVARTIAERHLSDKIAVVAFDADPEEIEALKAGAVDAIIVQDPYGMGYKGVMTAVDALSGKAVSKIVDTGVAAATMSNLNDPRIQDLLFPEKRK